MPQESQLRPFMDEVSGWLESEITLEAAQARATEFVTATDIRYSKQKILKKITEQETVEGLVTYLWSSLLSGEGDRVIR